MVGRRRFAARRGMTTMMVMLAVIVLVTMGGIGILAVTHGDSFIAGSFLDMRTKESAARSGLRDALGRMRNNPRNTVRQLQIFLDDSVTTTPHAWFVPVDDSFRLEDDRPGYESIGDDGSGFRVRLLGIDPGGAFGSPGYIELALESNGIGRSGDRQTVVGTYRMRGVEVAAITVPPATVDSYALYINGSMGNSTIATNISGNVYVGGNNHLNASVSITIDGNLRTQGNYKTSAPVTVTGKAYIGGYIENAAGGTMIIDGNTGVGGGFGNVNAPIVIGGALNVYGTELQGWNAKSYLTVGGQLLVRDMKFRPGGDNSVAGNAYFPKGVELPSGKSHLVAGNLEIDGPTSSLLDGDTLVVGRNLAARGSSSPNFEATGMRVGGDAYVQPAMTQTSGKLRIQGNSRFDNCVASVSGSPGIRIDREAWINCPTGQLGFNSGYLQLGTSLAMNGMLGANFGRSTGGYNRWQFDASLAPRTWSYQSSSEVTTYSPLVANSATNNSGPTGSGGPWRTGSVGFPTLSPWVPWLGLTSLGFTAQDTLVTLIDNPPDTVILAGPVEVAMRDFSVVKSLAGVTTSLNGASLNKLFNWYQTQGYLHNGYMIVRMNENVSMSDDGVSFTGKCLLVWDANLTTNMGWPPSASDDNIQVLFVRDGDLGNNFGSRGPFYGYIHYEKQWAGNHKWPPGAEMHGSLYLAGASSSIIGNGSELKLIRDQDVIDDIQQKLGILYPHGTVKGGSGSFNSRKLTLREMWVQFDRISEIR